MDKFKEMLRTLLILFVVALMASCQQAVQSVELDATSLVLALDSTDTLHAMLQPSELMADSIVVWQSSDSTVASVVDGVVRGNGVGRALIVAWADDKSDTCEVEVKIPVDSVLMNVRSVRVKAGSKVRLKAKVYPENATDTLINWLSSDTTVAIVARGVVHARGKGTVLISAEVDGQKVDCRVTVADIQKWQTEMSRRAERRGGNVKGALRFTLQWNDGTVWNRDDLDAHCLEPGGNQIYYSNKQGRFGGVLDVDIQRPYIGEKAIENISWSSLRKLKRNKEYLFFVERYADRGGEDGFRAEIEFGGQLYSYRYNGQWRQQKVVTAYNYWGDEVPHKVSYVNVAKVIVDEDGDLYIYNILPPVE